jgi:hypothetical protein
MIKKIAVVNLSTVVSPAEAIKMVTACNTQIARDVAPAWGRTAIPVVYYANERSMPVQSDAVKIYIFNNSDQAGALGYHSETMSGQIFGRIFAKTVTDYGLPVSYDPKRPNAITVSTVLSHEVLEAFCDPYVNLWSDGPAIAEGSEYAYEICDPVEANVYQIMATPNSPASNVSVSNFVYPEYFDTATPRGTKLDQMGVLTTPFSISKYGYMIVRRAPGQETAIYGSMFPEILKVLKGL